MEPVRFPRHALEQLPGRGANEEKVVAAINGGERVPAKQGRIAFRKNFPLEDTSGHPEMRSPLEGER